MRGIYKGLLVAAAALAFSIAAHQALAGTPDQIQACQALNPAGKVDPMAVAGCPQANLFWGPVTTTDLVRTSANGIQKWVAYNTVTPSTFVLRKTGGAWVALSSITVTPNPTTGGGSSGPVPPVVPPYSRSVAVSWAAPTLNSDGTPLTDLASYNVYMGATAASLLPVGKVLAPTTSFSTSPLTVGSYAFTVTAVNSSGVESTQAPVITTQVSKPATTPTPPTGIKATVGAQ